LCGPAPIRDGDVAKLLLMHHCGTEIEHIALGCHDYYYEGVYHQAVWSSGLDGEGLADFERMKKVSNEEPGRQSQ
jgi:hypothetical protein